MSIVHQTGAEAKPPMQGVILAAGKGTRLGHLTRSRSKAMMPVVGRPIVERVMETLTANGVADFVLVIGPDDYDIVRHFERAARLPARVRFARQPARRGMAHALQCAAPFIHGDFILSACDNLVAPGHVGRLLAAWQASPRPNAVLAVMPVEPARLGNVGIVVMDGPWVTSIVEKPPPEQTPPAGLSSLPLYCFSRRFLDYLPAVPLSPRGEYDVADAIQMLVEREGRVPGVLVDRRLTLTSPADLLTINRHYLLAGDAASRVVPYQVGADAQLIAPLHVEEGVVVGAHCRIGPGVVVERDCRIGDGAVIRDAVILRGSVVPAGAVIVNEVVG